MNSATRRQKKILIFLLIGIFVLSLLYSFYFRIPLAVDAHAYDTIAWNLVLGHGYRESLEFPLNNNNAIIRVGPGYEFFLAALYVLFGHHYEVVWVVQALLLTLTAFLMFLIAQEVFGANFSIGIAAAVLVGFSPDLITMQGMLMTETLGIFFIVLMVYLFFRYVNFVEIKRNNLRNERSDIPHPPPPLSLVRRGGQGGSGSSLWLAGLVAFVLGLATLVRTPSILLTLPMGGYLLWQRRWKEIILMAIVGILVFTPWTVRNYRIYSEFIPTNLASGFNLLAGNHPGANGEQEPYSILDEYVKNYGYVEANRRATQDALSFIVSHPLEYAKLTLLRASIYFSFARPTGFWFHLSGFSKAITLLTSAVYAATLFVFGFWGIGAYLKERKAYGNNALWLLGMLVMMPIAIIPIIVETRYRMPVYPFFALFAGFGFWKLRESTRCLSCFALVVFLVFANTAFDILRNTERILERISSL